uniref:Transcription factor TFIIE alpha subunit C-terminal domain-containing protein n=2 Tax=Aplanochytrium stocchinoi TaxID=215587 RepID=A0A7S3PJ84_9STRA|mmetsp:Transcript_28270/g.34439  ORF Transcript_28270/g.34439 Transcript_28270/m.34439 type:complete len:260 (+) Transcript_28270:159-938(+)
MSLVRHRDGRTRNTLEEQLTQSRELGREGIDDLLTALKVLRVPDNKPDQYLKGENNEKLTVDDEGKAKGGRKQGDEARVLIDNQYYIQNEMKMDEDADEVPATALPVWMRSDAVGGTSSIAIEDARDREEKKVSSKSAIDKKEEKVYELGGAIDMWEYRKGLAEKKKKKAVDSVNMDINSEDSIGLGLNDNGNDNGNGNEVHLDENDSAMEIDENTDSPMVSVTVQGKKVSLYKVTEADTDAMTDQEYEIYAKLLQQRK